MSSQFALKIPNGIPPVSYCTLLLIETPNEHSLKPLESQLNTKRQFCTLSCIKPQQGTESQASRRRWRTAADRQVKLDRESELRIEVGYDAPLKFRLLSGTAEIFGTELPPDFWLTFAPRLKFAVFTWNGATVEMEGRTETEYTADETPNIRTETPRLTLAAR